MADTTQNILLPAGQWVDLYAGSGFPAGTALSVANIGAADVYVTVAASEPPIGYDAYNVINRANGVLYRNTAGDAGAWAYSQHCDGKLNVREVVAP